MAKDTTLILLELCLLDAIRLPYYLRYIPFQPFVSLTRQRFLVRALCC